MTTAEELRRLAPLLPQAAAELEGADTRHEGDVAALTAATQAIADQAALIDDLRGHLENLTAPGFGDYEPNLLTTGPTKPLKKVTGNITVSGDGQTVEGEDRFGTISVTGRGCRIRDSRVRGTTTAPGQGRGLIHATNAAVRDLVVEDVLLQPDVPHYNWLGITGHDYTTRRCRIANVTDGWNIFNTANPDGPVNVRDEGSWVTGLAHFRPAGSQTEGSHNDGAQIFGGSGIYFLGTRFDCFLDPMVGQSIGNQYFPWMTGTSCVMITPTVGKVADVTLDRVLMRGGSTGLNVSENGRGPIRGLALTGARFGRDQRIAAGKKVPVQAFIARSTFDLASFSGVVFEDGIGAPKLQRV